MLEKNKIDGLGIALDIRKRLAVKVEELHNTFGICPKIAIVLVGHHEPSEIYVKQKQKVAGSVGIDAKIIRFEENIKEKDLLQEINILNNDNDIHGMIVQLPLPSGIDAEKVLLTISPTKDIDGLHPLNAGLLHSSKLVPYSIDEVLSLDFNNTEKRNKFQQLGKTLPFVPCTPLGCLHLIQKTFSESNEDVVGKNAVIFGNSNLVSKPMARLLLQSGATTTTLQSRIKNFDYIFENADIIVSATGKRQQLKNIKDGAILIDIGIHKISGQDGIFGDLNFQEIVKTNRITPVPKGVGPMTVASLMVNSFLSVLRKI